MALKKASAHQTCCDLRSSCAKFAHMNPLEAMLKWLVLVSGSFFSSGGNGVLPLCFTDVMPS